MTEKFPCLCTFCLPPARYHHKYLLMVACKWGRHSKTCTRFAAPGVLHGPGLKVASKALWGALSCQRRCSPQICSLLTAGELASCSRETAFQTASSKPRKKAKKTKGKWGSHIYDLGRNFTIPSNRKGVSDRLFRAPAFCCSAPPSSAGSMTHWCVLTRSCIPSDTINSEEAKVISLPDLLPHAGHKRAWVHSKLSSLYMKVSLDLRNEKLSEQQCSAVWGQTCLYVAIRSCPNSCQFLREF